MKYMAGATRAELIEYWMDMSTGFARLSGTLITKHELAVKAAERAENDSYGEPSQEVLDERVKVYAEVLADLDDIFGDWRVKPLLAVRSND